MLNIVQGRLGKLHHVGERSHALALDNRLPLGQPPMCAHTELNIIWAPCAGRGFSRLSPGTTSLPGIHN